MEIRGFLLLLLFLIFIIVDFYSARDWTQSLTLGQARVLPLASVVAPKQELSEYVCFGCASLESWQLGIHGGPSWRFFKCCLNVPQKCQSQVLPVCCSTVDVHRGGQPEPLTRTILSLPQNPQPLPGFWLFWGQDNNGLILLYLWEV